MDSGLAAARRPGMTGGDHSERRNIPLTLPQIRTISAAVPGPQEGRFAVVTERRARDAMDAVASGGFYSPGETFTADGEVVWSWRRDPGVKPFGKSRMATVAKEAAHRGEHEAAVKTIARGKSGRSG